MNQIRYKVSKKTKENEVNDISTESSGARYAIDGTKIDSSFSLNYRQRNHTTLFDADGGH